MVSPAIDLRPYQRRLTRAEYHALVEVGAFAGERLELLHGVLVTMSPQSPPHAYPIQSLTMLLGSQLVGRAVLRVQLPVVAADESEPEPDLALVPPGDYLEDHPAAVLLVIEVAASEPEKDLVAKAHLYALSGFPEYWVLDLLADEAVVHRGPRPDGAWQQVVRYGREEVLPVPSFPDVRVPLAQVLPPRR